MWGNWFVDHGYVKRTRWSQISVSFRRLSQKYYYIFHWSPEFSPHLLPYYQVVPKYVFINHLWQQSLTAALQEGWKMAPSLRPSRLGQRKAFPPALQPAASTHRSDTAVRSPERRWSARRRSWPTLPSEGGVREETTRGALTLVLSSTRYEGNGQTWKHANLSFLQVVVEPPSFEWADPLSSLSALTTW